MARIEQNELRELQQHLDVLRNEITRNRQVIDSASWKDSPGGLAGIINSTEFLVKVVDQAEGLITYYQRTKDAFPSPAALTVAFVAILLLAATLWPVILSLLAGRY